MTTTKAVELVSRAPTLPPTDTASIDVVAWQRAVNEFHALTDSRDPPDPADVAYEQERLVLLDAQAAETRRNIADAALGLGSAAFADYLNASAPTGADLPIIPLRNSLDAVETFLRRFVVFGRPEAIVAVVLWVAHTYAMDAADATPYLAVTSPEKGSGKTRLLECVGLLARSRPQIFIIPTAATIYRMLEADPSAPLLLDELDAVFRDRSDKYEEVRALINAGHRRGATVPRTVTTGNRHEVRFFPVFGPKVLAGIGKLPDTVADRSIPIRMLKKKPTEPVEKWRGRAASREAEPVALALEAALQAAPPALEAIVPNELPDRVADAWEPLLAIADAAGGEWPRRSRRAAIILHADRAEDDSLGLRLLSDTRLVFDRLAVDRLATVSLIDALRADEESPWLDDRHPLTPERLARYLKAFEIRSKQMKIANIKVRGFERISFVDSWDRYLSSPGTPSQSPVPRYPEHAAGTDVPGCNGGTGSQTAVPSTDEIACASYLEHQFHHRFTTAGGWTCDACHPETNP